MKAPAIICCMLALAALPGRGDAESAAAPPEGGLLPPLPTREQIIAQPQEEQLAQRTRVKQVLLQRALRQKDDGARLLPENAAECLALAERIGAPEPLVQMLRLEAGGLHGRDLYEYRQAFSRLTAAYGVDALQMRLCTEQLSLSTAELRRAFEGIPLEHIFDLVPISEPDEEEITRQMSTLASVYNRLADALAGVTDRVSADAAAEALIPLLPDFNSTLLSRLRVEQGSQYIFLKNYASIVAPVVERLERIRRPIAESAFYGSSKLTLLDYLLS